MTPRPHSPRSSRRRDELLGLWAGTQLAAGLGLLAGTVTAVVFLAWIAVAGAAGTFGGGSANVLAGVGWWGVLWVALSLGLLTALWLGQRLWLAAYPAARRREAARAQREAVEAAVAMLEDARSTPERRR
ncbi:MAG: hypothetical protein M0R73_03935 [Dehalococcoidia bacterium]|nr:hypothetical protein [Dehalococcoidia bacterium]